MIQKSSRRAYRGSHLRRRLAARELHSVKPAIDGLRSAVQDAFFAPPAGQIRAVADAVVGPLRSGMQGVAREFGLAGAEAARFASSSATVSAITSIFGWIEAVTLPLLPTALAAVAGFKARHTPRPNLPNSQR